MKLLAVLVLALAVSNCNCFEKTTYDWWAHMDNEEWARHHLGLHSDFDKDHMLSMFLSQSESDFEAPESFDWRKVLPICIHPVRDQGHCGSCWAHSASEVVSDRFCIQSTGRINKVFSPQQLVDCDLIDQGCSGGFLTTPFIYYSLFGAQEESCFGEYTSGKTSKRGSWCFLYKWQCPVYRTNLLSIRWLMSPAAIKEQLVKYGPVNTGFKVYEDFRNYKSGIYEHKTGDLLGGHAVKIVGYGKENGVDFWIVQNSWTEKWGENGFFRIKFGEGGIDSGAVSINPWL